MPACLSCHSLCEKPKTYKIYYGTESFRPYAPGSYDEYNKKSISEQVVSDKVYICRDCANKAGDVNKNKHLVKLWTAGASNPKGIKSCYRCHHISESRFCNQYKYALPWWLKYFVDLDQIEYTIDLGPVRHMAYCRHWKPLSSVDKNSGSSLKSQFQMGLYLIKYYKNIRKKLKSFLFQDLFSLNHLADDIQRFLNSNSSASILDRAYSKLFYRPYRNFSESNFYKKYYTTRAKLKDWAEALS